MFWHPNLTFDDYYQYINEPKHLVNPERDLRMFTSDFIENYFSKTPWYMVPIAWLPMNIWFISNMTASTPFNIFMIIFGIVSWGFAEYILHRFVFHGEDTWMRNVKCNNTIFTFHFMIHGIHHAFPQDAMRLVFPPALAHILFFVVFWLPMLPVPDQIKFPWFMGVYIGYLSYDLMHYAFHHSNPAEGTFFKEMKTYHMQHHYKHGQVGFGVSQKFWDKVFGTELIINKAA